MVESVLAKGSVTQLLRCDLPLRQRLAVAAAAGGVLTLDFVPELVSVDDFDAHTCRLANDGLERNRPKPQTWPSYVSKCLGSHVWDTRGRRYVDFTGGVGAIRLGYADPDLAVYAKAMSNGFPCAAILGRDAVMDAANPSFISSTYWTDGVGPAAAVACIHKLQAARVQEQVWKLGGHLQQQLLALAAKYPALQLKVAG